MRYFCLIFCCLFLFCSCDSSREAGRKNFYEKGCRAASSGNSAEAAVLLEKAVLAGDQAVQAHYRLGGLYEKLEDGLPLAIWHYQEFLKQADHESGDARAAGIRLDILEKKYLRILREKWEGAIDSDKEFRIGLLEEREEVLKQSLQRINEENYVLRQLLLEEKKSRTNRSVAEAAVVQVPKKSETMKTPSLRMHRVTAGDTIGKIASHYYGSSRIEYIRKILAANREHLSNPDHLRIGQMLVIPR